MNLRTPLRYPGGKRKLADFMEQFIIHNNLLGSQYAEPFAGGAGLAIELLKRKAVSRIYLNDIDKNIYSFWHSVLYKNEDICTLIENTPVTIEQWYKQKECLLSEDLLTRGFATFFLNRTNRSGIIWGGVIGGKLQTGKWKIDCRFNKVDLIEKIKTIGRYRDQITFTNFDAEIFLSDISLRFTEKSLIYLDPPYYEKGVGLYENHYKHDDHERLASLIKKLKTPWVVSYDDNPNINGFFQDQNKINYLINYSAQHHIKGKEVIFCNNSTFPKKTIF